MDRLPFNSYGMGDTEHIVCLTSLVNSFFPIITQKLVLTIERFTNSYESLQLLIYSHSELLPYICRKKPDQVGNEKNHGRKGRKGGSKGREEAREAREREKGKEGWKRRGGKG